MKRAVVILDVYEARCQARVVMNEPNLSFKMSKEVINMGTKELNRSSDYNVPTSIYIQSNG
jgi:hypothetical protein